jgi:K+-transporting ATPase ATPase C chain
MHRTWEQIRPEVRPLLTVTVTLLLITAVIYPLAVFGVGQLVFHRQANGSIITVDGRPVGSSLIGQEFTQPQYFHPRPSAANYDASASSGSNLGPTSALLINGVHDAADPGRDIDGIRDRVAAFRKENGLAADVKVPADAVTASASGLDPDISPATARLEVARVAQARGVSAEAIRALVDHYTEGAFVGFIGQPRVNVLKLNLALDQHFPVEK